MNELMADYKQGIAGLLTQLEGTSTDIEAIFTTSNRSKTKPYAGVTACK
jgi:hypothetical protein